MIFGVNGLSSYAPLVAACFSRMRWAGEIQIENQIENEMGKQIIVLTQ